MDGPAIVAVAAAEDDDRDDDEEDGEAEADDDDDDGKDDDDDGDEVYELEAYADDEGADEPARMGGMLCRFGAREMWAGGGARRAARSADMRC